MTAVRQLITVRDVMETTRLSRSASYELMDRLGALKLGRAKDAWERCCYAAWVTRRDEHRMAPIRQAMHEAQQDVARKVVEHLDRMTPEERAKFLKLAERGE